MSLLLLIIHLILLIYFFSKSQGVVLAYILFFQEIPLILFTDIGFANVRFVFYFLVVLVFIFMNFKKEFRISKLRYCSTNIIFIGVFLVFFCMLMHYTIFGIKNLWGYEIVEVFLIKTLPLILLATLFISREKTLLDLGKGILIWGFILFLILLFVSNITDLSFSDRRGIQDLTDTNPITFGRMYGMIFIVSVIYYFHLNSNVKRIQMIFMMLISLFIIFFAGSRGPILAAVIALMTYFLFKIKESKDIYRIIFAIFVIFFISIALLSVADFDIVDRFLALEDYQNMPRYWRIVIVLNALPNIGLVGLGPGGFYYLTGEASFHVHNLFLEMVLEYGIFGLVSFFLVVVSGFIIFYRLINSNEIDYRLEIIFPLWVMFLMAAMVSGYISGNRDVWILTGLIITVSYIVKNNKIKISRILTNKYKNI